MHDRDDAPTGATGESTPRWPEPHEWPAADASTLEWARFWFHDCRFHDLRPTPAQEDRDAHARYLAGEAESEWRWAHGGAEVPLNVAVQIRSDAQALADGVRGPIPALTKRPSPVTDADLVRWFTPSARSKGDAARTQHHLARGVCVHLGEQEARLAQIDADVGHVGRIDADLTTALVRTPGLRVATPHGGVQVFLRAAPGQVVHHSDGALQVGVEVRTSGWALLPSGAATPGRVVASPERPGVVPAALLVPAPRTPRSGDKTTADRPPVVGADGRPLGRTAAIVASPIGRGDGRTAAARTIVGMLAKPEGLPADVVDALAALLTEYAAGRDWSAPRVREEVLRWRELLTRGPRDATFAAEVLETWLAVRDVGPTYKGAQWARATARSLWKTADRREEGQAGAEDLGHLGGVGDHPPAPVPPRGECVAADAPITAIIAEVRASDYVIHGPGLVPAPEAAAGEFPRSAAEDARRAREAAERETVLRALLPSIAAAYPRESLRRDFEKVPARVEVLYPFADFRTGLLEQGEMGAPPVGHGYGRDFGRAYGGITEGDFQAFGAAGAKGGKTFFVGQMADGLAMDTAARVLGVPGYESRPLVMPVWVSEMPKEGEVWLRFISRHFGFDLSALSKGTMSAEMPGVLHMAQENGMTPAQVVALARRIAETYDDPRFADTSHALGVREAGGVDVVPAWAAHHVVREIDLSVLPRATGQGRARVDPRSGPDLVGWVADAVALLRRDLAAQAAVAEDQVLPLVILDPGQRFAGEGSSSKDALDSLLGAVVSRICRRRTGLGAACIMSSDTTKAAARDLDLDAFLSASGQRLAADIFAGSQGIMHHCDVYAICGQDTGVAYRQTQWVRVLQSRTGAPAQCYPFSWETHLGRFRPRPAEPLREARDGDQRRGGGSGGGGRPRGPRSWTPPGQVGDHDPPPQRLPPYRQNGGRPHYGPRDD